MSIRHAAAFVLTGVAIIGAAAGTALLLTPAHAAGAAAPAVADSVLQWGLIAAAAATGVSSLAAGYAVAAVGSAALGALAEKPELFGRLLVLVGLAEGIAIYGLIVSVLILNRLG
jgi:V/A-type H+-transporting ATPase subunit K